jgi:hypothetical protein
MVRIWLETIDMSLSFIKKNGAGERSAAPLIFFLSKPSRVGSPRSKPFFFCVHWFIFGHLFFFYQFHPYLLNLFLHFFFTISTYL